MKRRVVLWFLVALGAALLVEVALVMMIVTSSEGSTGARGTVASAREFVFGSETTPNVLERLGSSTGNVASEVKEVVLGKRTSAGSTVTKDAAKFAECLSCHRDYASKVRFSASVIDHAEHAELGIECADCHLDTAHPYPEPPREEQCAQCHDVQDKEGCEVCHPPGSLPHFYKLGFPRDGAVECDSCHPPGAFELEGGGGAPLPSINPSDRDTCAGCHAVQTCQECHGDTGTKGGRGPLGGPGPHPPDWTQGHGPQVLDGAGGCGDCHKSSCAEGCHGSTSQMGQYAQVSEE